MRTCTHACTQDTRMDCRCDSLFNFQRLCKKTGVWKTGAKVEQDQLVLFISWLSFCVPPLPCSATVSSYGQTTAETTPLGKHLPKTTPLGKHFARNYTSRKTFARNYTSMQIFARNYTSRQTFAKELHIMNIILMVRQLQKLHP